MPYNGASERASHKGAVQQSGYGTPHPWLRLDCTGRGHHPHSLPQAHCICRTTTSLPLPTHTPPTPRHPGTAANTSQTRHTKRQPAHPPTLYEAGSCHRAREQAAAAQSVQEEGSQGGQQEDGAVLQVTQGELPAGCFAPRQGNHLPPQPADAAAFRCALCCVCSSGSGYRRRAIGRHNLLPLL